MKNAAPGGDAMEKWIAPREAGDILSMTPEAVRRLIRLGKLRATRIGNRIRLAQREVEALVDGMEEGRRHADRTR
jgi:excisionase family DNA binding protein